MTASSFDMMRNVFYNLAWLPQKLMVWQVQQPAPGRAIRPGGQGLVGSLTQSVASMQGRPVTNMMSAGGFESGKIHSSKAIF